MGFPVGWLMCGRQDGDYSNIPGSLLDWLRARRKDRRLASLSKRNLKPLATLASPIKLRLSSRLSLKSNANWHGRNHE